MPRELTADEKTVATGRIQHLAIFVEVNWPSGIARFWSGLGPIIYGGNTFTGVGTMGRISTIEEGTTGRANGITLSLAGCDPAIVSAVLSENYQHRKAAVYLGLCDSNWQLVHPVLREIFVGFVDVATDDDDAETSTVTLNIEPRMIIAQQSSGRRITHEARIAEYPTDNGYEYITAINREMIDNWGTPGAAILQRAYGQSQQLS
jgi:hypothetical protein